jgi:ribosomal protein L13E
MWDKNDWHQFFAIANKPWARRRPPRPVYPSGAKRVLPAVGFSLSELDDAGINMEAAERLGLRPERFRAARVRPFRAPTRKIGITYNLPAKPLLSVAHASPCGVWDMRVPISLAEARVTKSFERSNPFHPIRHRILLRQVQRPANC